jgi:hypothetical protein
MTHKLGIIGQETSPKQGNPCNKTQYEGRIQEIHLNMMIALKACTQLSSEGLALVMP